MNFDNLDEYDPNDQDIVKLKKMIENSQQREEDADVRSKQKEHITLDMTSLDHKTRVKHHRPKTSSTLRPQEINVAVIYELRYGTKSI